MSEAEELESNDVESAEAPAEAVEEQKKEVNTFIDFEDEDWKKVPTAQAEQVRARIARDSTEKARLRKQAEERERKNKELQSQLAELQKPKEVPAPPIDLAYENEAKFKEAQEAHNKSVRDQAAYEERQKLREEAEAADAQKKAQDRLDNFVSRGTNSGIDVSTLEVAANVVSPHLQIDVREFILDHEYGPQLLTKLQLDPGSLQNIAGLSVIQAGVKLDEMAKSFHRKLTSKAPPPDDPLSGVGAPSKGDQEWGSYE